MRPWLSIVHKSSYKLSRGALQSTRRIIHPSLKLFIIKHGNLLSLNQSNEFLLYSNNCTLQICQSISSRCGHALKENIINFFNVKKPAFNHFLISQLPCMVYDCTQASLFNIVTWIDPHFKCCFAQSTIKSTDQAIDKFCSNSIKKKTAIPTFGNREDHFLKAVFSNKAQSLVDKISTDWAAERCKILSQCAPVCPFSFTCV